MFTQTIDQKTSSSKYRWYIDCGDVDSDMEGYADTLEQAQDRADTCASFCPFAYVYIYDLDNNVIDAYWAK